MPQPTRRANAPGLARRDLGSENENETRTRGAVVKPSLIPTGRAALGDATRAPVAKAAVARTTKRPFGDVTNAARGTRLRAQPSTSVADPRKKTRVLRVRDDAPKLADDLFTVAPAPAPAPEEVAPRAPDHGWVDLDAGDESDIMMVTEYVGEVYTYLRELELKTLPDADYMARQSEITWKMRGILVDWLIEIHAKFRLFPETLFLAVNIIDRFLSTRAVSLVKFQLVGVTALFIASKYEEVMCPSVSNFLYMTDGGYHEQEMLRAERYILAMLDYNLSYPNPINFLRRYSKADAYDVVSRNRAKYLIEISLLDHAFVAIPPSRVAAAGLLLARRTLDRGPWDANLVHYSGYTEEELRPTAQLMLDYVVRTSEKLAPTLPSENPLQAAYEYELEHPNFIKKYSVKKSYYVATKIREWAEQNFGQEENQIVATNPVTGADKVFVKPPVL